MKQRVFFNFQGKRNIKEDKQELYFIIQKKLLMTLVRYNLEHSTFNQRNCYKRAYSLKRMD